MNPSQQKSIKLGILGAIITVTLGIHYGFLVEPFFGHVHWIHAIHGRFCYIPIVVAAAWFGLRGGLYTALLISALVLPYILGSELEVHNLVGEYVEIVFYFAIAVLAGALFDRELRARKRAEEMRLHLERTQKLSLLGQIAAGMAHEIKNPLASVKGAVEILSDGSTNPGERAEFKDIVFKEIRRMNRSITDFLEFARPTETKLQRLNLAEVFHSTIKQVQPQAAKRKISLDHSIADPVMVNGNGEKIHQVLLNLLLNAIDASPAGESVWVTLEQNRENNEAIIRIEDSGSGIPESELEKVFEPFFTTKSSGTGLGLAITKSIVDAHHGSIHMHNRTEGGVVAEVRIPLLIEETVS